MIVQIRLEVTEAQRSKIALLNNPKAKRRLATRAEVSDLMEAFFCDFTSERESTDTLETLPIAAPAPAVTPKTAKAESLLKTMLEKRRQQGWSQDKLNSYANAWRRVSSQL